MAKETTQEVAKVAESPYLPLVQEPTSVRDVITANVGEGGVSRFDLDKVTVPAGGGIAWMLPTLTGGYESAQDLIGIIVGFRDTRAYWRQGLDEGRGNTPPDCGSENSKDGIGRRWEGDDPTQVHDCLTCPMAAFGSDEGRAQACKQVRNLFLLRPGEMIPIIVQLPPTSLKGVRTFMLRLASRNLPHYAVVVRIGLDRQKNADGIAYAQATFAAAEQLDETGRGRMKQYVEAFAPIVRATRIDPAAAAAAQNGAGATATE